jgi:hypothetical protein
MFERKSLLYGKTEIPQQFMTYILRKNALVSSKKSDNMTATAPSDNMEPLLVPSIKSAGTFRYISSRPAHRNDAMMILDAGQQNHSFGVSWEHGHLLPCTRHTGQR